MEWSFCSFLFLFILSLSCSFRLWSFAVLLLYCLTHCSLFTDHCSLAFFHFYPCHTFLIHFFVSPLTVLQLNSTIFRSSSPCPSSGTEGGLRPQSMPAFASGASARYDQHIQQQHPHYNSSTANGHGHGHGDHQHVSGVSTQPTTPCSSSKNHPHQQPGKLYRVIYPYKPQQADELALTIGDILTVTMQCDDGWFVGHSTLTGNYGTFPGNYVQAIWRALSHLNWVIQPLVTSDHWSPLEQPSQVECGCFLSFCSFVIRLPRWRLFLTNSHL